MWVVTFFLYETSPQAPVTCVHLRVRSQPQRKELKCRRRRIDFQEIFEPDQNKRCATNAEAAKIVLIFLVVSGDVVSNLVKSKPQKCREDFIFVKVRANMFSLVLFYVSVTNVSKKTILPTEKDGNRTFCRCHNSKGETGRLFRLMTAESEGNPVYEPSASEELEVRKR